jgi:hypothetical protein
MYKLNKTLFTHYYSAVVSFNALIKCNLMLNSTLTKPPLYRAIFKPTKYKARTYLLKKQLALTIILIL